MILALLAKRKKTIACGILTLIYFETVLPSFALDHPGKSLPPAKNSGQISLPIGYLPADIAVPVAPAVVPIASNGVRRKPATYDIGGPTQPESQAFHAVNSDNMVDLFTGDFKYNIPLMDVGGYPITIGYNSGISMDQEASWVGLGWNINPGSITRNMRGLPDDFNGRDTITKTATIKENKTVGASAGADMEIIGLPLGAGSGQDSSNSLSFGVGASLGLSHNNYRGWGMEYGLNSSINVGRSGMGNLSGGLSFTNSSQEGFSVSPSFSVAFDNRRRSEQSVFDGSVSISAGTSYNSRSGMKALQLSAGIRQSDNSRAITRETAEGPQTFTPAMGSTFGSYISFAYPSYTPTITLPYTSSNTTVTLKVGFATKVVHPSFFVSGYVAKQYIAEKDKRAYYPAYGYLNYQLGARNPGALMDFNREKEIPYREKPAVPHIGLPTYTYDVFSMSGEGTGGMFRPYRSDIGFVYDHAMRTKDGSQRISVDIGLGDLVHGGVDLNFNRSYTQTGPWLNGNYMAAAAGFKNTDSVFEAAYFRNPGEMAINDGKFYNAIGGDDAVAVDLYQPGASSSMIVSTNQLARYRKGQLQDKIVLADTSTYKKTRDKRTQVISYLNAREASEVGLTKFIENYAVNQFDIPKDCDNIPPEADSPVGLLGEYYYGGRDNAFINWVWERIDPQLHFIKAAGNLDINVNSPNLSRYLDNDFSVQWFGRIKAPVTGTYNFYVMHDDGFKLFINDSTIFDQWWCQQGAADEPQRNAYVNLVAGQMYDVKVDFYDRKMEGRRNEKYELGLYWSYPGQSRQIIPKDYLYLRPAKDTFVTGIVSRENRVNNFRKENHISEIDVLNADGKRYIYGIPVYNLKQKEATFSVNATDGNNKSGLVKYTPGTDDDTSNTKGNDNYFSSEEIPAYAHTFLLTGILSPDYTDLTGNGISPDDPGDAIKFNYSKIAGIRNPYKWRAPYSDSATYNEGLKTDTRDDKGSYVYGEKELWYLHSVESKNMIATFKLSDREDLQAIDQRGQKLTGHVAKKLDEINLYTKADFLKNGSKAIPVKTVHFGYSYRLCPGVNAPVNNVGKLTLDTIWFSYNGNEKGKRNPYIFHYNDNNPGYNIKSYDRWGNYKDALQNPGSVANDVVTNAEYPYALQDSTLAAKNAAAWTLDSILLPSGGRIKVTYESDDYAYVQNKRAMSMFSIAGFSVAPPQSTGDIKNQMYGSEDHLYVAINVPESVASKADAAKYLQGIQKIYFRLYVQMPDDRNGSGSEYVPCYANVDQFGQSGFLNDGDKHIIWIKLKGVNAEGKDGDYSPLAKAAIQFLRLNLPSKAYPGSDIGDELDLDAAVRMLVTMGGNVVDAFRSFDNIARGRGWAKFVDTKRSFARLNSLNYKKYGGGLRVKQLVTYDNWNAMTKQKESMYGVEYQYTTDGVINGQPVQISSGVASYEPILGGEENPWHMPIEYQEQVSLLAPVSLGYTEEPLGESLFPSPVVGYSKVKVRSIYSKNRRSASGITETKFYTSYDFPTITEMTPINDDSKKRFRPKLANLLRINARSYLTVSQGFKVELNDMNGKLRSQATYAETDFKTPVTYTENYYRTAVRPDGIRQLDNNVMTISPQGEINASASIGKDVELMMDMREQQSVTNGNNFNINGDFFSFPWPPVWLIPSLLNLAQREETRFRSAAVTKVINRHGILDSTIAIDKGSKVVTHNLLYDSETGDPVLTSIGNEFDDTLYHFTYPSGWAYDGMSGAYKNIGITMSHVFMNSGKIYKGMTPELVNRYFASGDEILLWSKQQTGGSACDIAYATWPNSARVWAVDANAMNGNGGTPDIYFVDEDGQPFTGYDINLKLIRSGRKNIAATVGSVNMMRNPLTKSMLGGQEVWSFQIGDSSKVIDASAVEFQQLWRVADRGKLSYVTNCVPRTYQQYINDGACPNPVYTNSAAVQTFIKNDCDSGGIPGTFQYIVPEGSYSAPTQHEADSMALAEIWAQGQAFANAYASCTYYNDELKKSFVKNDCPGGPLGDDCGVMGTISTVLYSVPAGKYSSAESKEEANALAQQELDKYGQAYANSTGQCTYYNMERAGAFSRNDCPGGSVVIYTVPQGTYTSTTSWQDAEAQAEADIQRNGQAYANQHGTCPAGGGTIYVVTQVDFVSSTDEADFGKLIFKFYSDPDLTIPYSVTNLQVNYKRTRTDCDGSSPVEFTATATCNGTSTDAGQVQINEHDTLHCWKFNYQAVAGNGYQVAP